MVSEDKDLLFKLLEKMYYWEHERKDRINMSLSLPGGIVVLIISVIIYFLKSVSANREGAITIVFFCAIILLVAATIFSIYFLGRALFGYEIGFIDTSSDFYEFHKNLTDYHKSESQNLPEGAMLENFREELNEQYSKYATANRITNNRKSGYLHKSLVSIIFSLFLLIVTSIPYYFIYQEDNFPRSNDIQNYNYGTSNMSEPKPKPPKPKPKPPGGSFIKEGEVKKKY